MKNLLFAFTGLTASFLIMFAAYNKIMFADSTLLPAALIFLFIFSIVTLVDIGIAIFKKNSASLIWMILFIQFSGIAQLVYYSKKVLTPKADL